MSPLDTRSCNQASGMPTHENECARGGDRNARTHQLDYSAIAHYSAHRHLHRDSQVCWKRHKTHTAASTLALPCCARRAIAVLRKAHLRHTRRSESATVAVCCAEMSAAHPSADRLAHTSAYMYTSQTRNQRIHNVHPHSSPSHGCKHCRA